MPRGKIPELEALKATWPEMLGPLRYILARYWARANWMLIGIAVLVMVSSVSAVAAPYMFSRLIDTLQAGNWPETILWGFAGYAVLLGLAMSLQSVVSYMSMMSAETLQYVASTSFFSRLLEAGRLLHRVQSGRDPGGAEPRRRRDQPGRAAGRGDHRPGHRPDRAGARGARRDHQFRDRARGDRLRRRVHRRDLPLQPLFAAVPREGDRGRPDPRRVRRQRGLGDGDAALFRRRRVGRRPLRRDRRGDARGVDHAGRCGASPLPACSAARWPSSSSSPSRSCCRATRPARSPSATSCCSARC